MNDTNGHVFEKNESASVPMDTAEAGRPETSKSETTANGRTKTTANGRTTTATNGLTTTATGLTTTATTSRVNIGFKPLDDLDMRALQLTGGPKR